MTDLQASLMAIGGTIVIGVITYNKWQEYKAKKSVERAFSSAHDDVLMNPDALSSPSDGGRHEPTLASEGDERVTASSEATSVQATQEKKEGSEYKELPIDELIDCATPLSLGSPVRGEKLLPKLQTLRHVGNKPVQFIGQRESGDWEPIVHGSIYYALKAGVQLANRSTGLNEIEYSEFITRLRQIADEIDAELEVPDMVDVIADARSLHQFVTEHDAQLSVNVRSNGEAWAINTLLAALERHGFDLRPDGRLVMSDGEGGILFSLSTNVTLAAETTSRLTLLLDVPRVAQSKDGFGAMTACAKMLASRLDGTVVDDSNQILTDTTLNEIAEQVTTFYSHMERADIPAGSKRALRLFS